MTVSKALIKWLSDYPGVKIDDIDTDRLEANAESYGLYKQPENIITEYIDGARKHTEYYYLLCRQDVQEESSRVSNQEFLSQLEDWIEEKDLNGEYPEGYLVEEIGVTNSFYMQAADEDEAVYQLSIGIVYMKERK